MNPLAGFLHDWRAAPRDLRLLNGARLARSIAQGAIATDFLLYLRALHWSGSAIGSLLAGALVFAMTCTVAGSLASDRYGRRRFLLAFDGVYIAACAVAAQFVNPWILGACAVVAGFGRGANGTPGPFAAVEKAWITQGEDKAIWARALQVNSTLGFFGMAIGAGVATLPAWFRDAHGVPGYRMLFWIALVPAAASWFCVFLARDRHAAVVAEVLPHREEQAVRREENRNLRRLALVNLVRGAGIGLVGPMMSYWFATRFHAGPLHIGGMMAAGFLIASVSSQISGRAGMKYGMMAVVVRLRSASILVIAALALAPNLTVATVLYLLMVTLDRSSNAPRAAISANLVRNKRRGLAGTVAAVSQQATRSLGPVLAGAIFDLGWLAAPLLVGAALQGGYLYLYQRFFREKDPVDSTENSKNAPEEAGVFPAGSPQGQGG